MAKVYYKIINLNDYLSDVETQLNTLGTAGWELSTIFNESAILISGSSGITVTGSIVLPAGTVSSSGQVNYLGLSNIPANIVSSSGQVKTFLPAGTVSSSVQINTGSFTGSFVGSLTGLGNLKLESGSNKMVGTAVLNGANPGTVTVSNTLVTAASIILLTKQTAVHPQGNVSISAKSTNSFTILSNHNGDTDTVAYVIINPV